MLTVDENLSNKAMMNIIWGCVKEVGETELNDIQTQKRLQRTLFIMTKHNMQMFRFVSLGLV